MDIATLHSKQFNYLSGAYNSDRLHHAYIFYGPAGSGKFLFSLYFSKFIQCTDNKEGKPCGKCVNCKVSRDEFIINAHIINKGKDESILIEEVREFQKNIGLSISGKGRKIYIINNAQNLGREAREVLLKTLEEPPEKSLIILLTDEKKYLPQTILSRCPAVFFPRPSIAKMKKNMNEDILESAFTLYFNNLDLLRKSDKEEVGEEYAHLINDLDVIAGGGIFEKMNLARDIALDKKPREMVEKWISIMYNLFLKKMGLAAGTEGQSLNNLEKKLDYDRIVEILEELFKVMDRLDTNVSKRILFEDFMLRI